MADLIEWPCNISGSESDDWRLVGSTEGQRTLSGFPQFKRRDGGGLWTVTMTDILLASKDAIRTWDSITGIMDEGAVPVAVPYLIKATQPYLDDTALEATYSDGATHSDGSPFESNAIDCELEEKACLRATQLYIRRNRSDKFSGGERFSINHADWGPRLYKVIRVLEGRDDSVTKVEIRPPLRARTEPGYLEFDRPLCTMTIADPAGAGGPLNQRRYGTRTITFIEFGRLPE